MNAPPVAPTFFPSSGKARSTGLRFDAAVRSLWRAAAIAAALPTALADGLGSPSSHGLIITCLIARAATYSAVRSFVFHLLRRCGRAAP
jgi:hypothetical protein